MQIRAKSAGQPGKLQAGAPRYVLTAVGIPKLQSSRLKRMKVLLISRFFPYIGGAEMMVFTIAEELSQNHHIGIATPDRGFVSQKYEVMSYTSPEELEGIIGSFRPDVINSHTLYLTPDAIEPAKVWGIPLILTLHGDILGSSRPEDRQMFIDFSGELSHIVAVSNNGRRELIKHGFSATTVSSIRNGIDSRPFTDRIGKKNALREALSLPLGQKIFVTPARLTYYKGLEFLLRTVRRLRGSGAMFIISAPDYEEKEIRHLKYAQWLTALMERWRITNTARIQYHKISDMPSLYQASDCLILPSKSGEGIPISVLEAMASRIPVIATDIGGLREVIKDRYTGYLVGYDDEELLAERIRKVIKGGREVKKIKKNGFQKVKGKFSSKRMIREYEVLLAEIKGQRYKQAIRANAYED